MIALVFFAGFSVGVGAGYLAVKWRSRRSSGVTIFVGESWNVVPLRGDNTSLHTTAHWESDDEPPEAA